MPASALAGICGSSTRRREIYPEEGGVMFHKASFLQAVPSEHLPAAQALRRPLPGVAPSLRLEDAGDAKPAWITLLTTEHYNLQMQRVATISESNGRVSVFLGAVSAGLIALGFKSSTCGAGPVGRMIFQVLVLTPLVFLGLVAFVRCLEIAIDDCEFVTRIIRLRCTYDQLVPELAPLMSQAVADDGLVAMLSPRRQPFQKMLSVAGSVAVITSVVVGGDAGVIVFGVAACCTWPLPSAPQPEHSPSDGRAGISDATGVRRPGRRPETSPPAEPLARTSGRCHEPGPRTSSPGCRGLRASPVDMAAWQLAAGSSNACRR